MPRFEIFYAELTDLAPDDPMRPAAIVHITGSNAKKLYIAISSEHSMYVIGRGPLSPELGQVGYFLTASRPDYPVLRLTLEKLWPDMPDFPRQSSEPRTVQSQEIADVANYIRLPRVRDRSIFREVRTRLQGLIPAEHLIDAARVAQWLAENMLPANNCYTLSALFAYWLARHNIPAEFCQGQAILDLPNRPPLTLSHAWVEVEGTVCDLTVNQQSAWKLPQPVQRIDVDCPWIQYQPGRGRYQDLDTFWLVHSKPPGRTYTQASLKRHARFIQEFVPSPLLKRRQQWIDLIWEYGVAEGTHQLLTRMLSGGKL